MLAVYGPFPFCCHSGCCQCRAMALERHSCHAQVAGRVGLGSVALASTINKYRTWGHRLSLNCPLAPDLLPSYSWTADSQKLSWLWCQGHTWKSSRRWDLPISRESFDQSWNLKINFQMQFNVECLREEVIFNTSIFPKRCTARWVKLPFEELQSKYYTRRQAKIYINAP